MTPGFHLLPRFWFFCFAVRLKKQKWDLKKPHKTRIHKENTIVIRTLGVRISMVCSYGCGGGIWTSRPPGYEPDELPGCSTPRYIIIPWCRWPGSNRYGYFYPRDFKSRASACSATPAGNTKRLASFRFALLIIAHTMLFVNPFLKKLSSFSIFRSTFFNGPTKYLAKIVRYFLIFCRNVV